MQNDIISLASQYNRPEDFLADLRRYNSVLTQGLGSAGALNGIYNQISDPSKQGLYFNQKTIKGKNGINQTSSTGANFKPGGSSPLRSYLERNGYVQPVQKNVVQNNPSTNKKPDGGKQELLAINSKYGVSIPSYAEAQKILDEAQKTGQTFSALAKKKYPKKK
jgi:hypothetical protein